MFEGAKRNELLFRTYFVMLVFVGMAAAIVWKVIDISVVNGDKWREKKENKYMVWRPVPTQRGDIYADDGQSLLATSVEFFDIRMDPVVSSDRNFYENIDGLCRKLAEYPGGKSFTAWKSYIVGARKAYHQKKKGGTRNLFIANQVDHDGYMKMKSYPLFALGQYKGGFKKNKSYRRKKPFEALASRTIGEFREANMVGLENSFDELLTGEKKSAYMQKIPGGIYVPVYDPTDFELCKGQDIVTTLNMPLQDVVHHELRKSVAENNAEGGVAIMMEVATGRIKAMSNLSRLKSGAIGENHNRAIADRVEPGSTIKAASVLALLEDGLATSETIVDFNHGRKKFYDRWMEDSGRHGLKYGTLQMALEKSSNVGIANALQEAYGAKVKRDMYYQKMMQFGFDGPTGIDIKGERAPYVKNPKNKKDEWYGTTIPWMAHGYELSMTPLQVLNFYNAIANNGKLMQPQMVKAIIDADGDKKNIKPVVKRSNIASRENIDQLKIMLEGVVERGTAKSLKSKSYRFAGKTGTTKVGYVDGEEVKYNASFAGYWPAENPKYSMIVVVYGLKGVKYYGNVVAGPVFKRIMDWSYALQDGGVAVQDVMTPETSKSYDGELHGFSSDFEKVFDGVAVNYLNAGKWVRGGNDGDGRVVSVKSNIVSGNVPNLEGMGLRDAVFVLENLGMKVDSRGVGRVVKQSISAGSKIDNQEITLYLN